MLRRCPLSPRVSRQIARPAPARNLRLPRDDVCARFSKRDPSLRDARKDELEEFQRFAE